MTDVGPDLLPDAPARPAHPAPDPDPDGLRADPGADPGRILRQPGAPRLAAVVVTHNRRVQLKRTVRRLLDERLDHLLVVDNASNDGSTDWLEGVDDPRLCLIRLAQNCGGAGGFEQGLREVMARFDPDWCVVMDDDARPEPGIMARFSDQAAALTQAGWEALAAGVFYPDGAICEMNRPSRNPFWNLKSFLRTLMGGGRMGFHMADAAYDAQAVQRIDATSFVGLFLSRQAILRVGYPDGNLFIYGDDVLYTLGLSRAGGPIGFAPWLRFEHDCTTFRRGGGQVHRPLWKVYYNYRNGLLGYRAAAGPVMFWPVLLIVLPKWALKAPAYGPEWRGYLQLLGLAVGDGLRNRRDRPHREIRVIARHIGRVATARAQRSS
ncbi:glycosyltransferase [Paracoccaceae bacterium Fryx2]|nr:glycosyltransferase [Paracoccaceae bacterium Fryx2]